MPPRKGSTHHPSFNSTHLVCQVESCGKPLTALKDYHQRYKICEEHLRVDCLDVHGHNVRFCQQCGRFQPLEDFDGKKRSCRERLQRHNARRRKRPDYPEHGSHTVPHPITPLDSAVAIPSESFRLSTEELLGNTWAMQETIQFLAATLALITGSHQQTEEGTDDVDDDGHTATVYQNAASILSQASPYVPTPVVMLTMLKAYAHMYHYDLEEVIMQPLLLPTDMSGGGENLVEEEEEEEASPIDEEEMESHLQQLVAMSQLTVPRKD